MNKKNMNKKTIRVKKYNKIRSSYRSRNNLRSKKGGVFRNPLSILSKFKRSIAASSFGVCLANERNGSQSVINSVVVLNDPAQPTGPAPSIPNNYDECSHNFFRDISTPGNRALLSFYDNLNEASKIKLNREIYRSEKRNLYEYIIQKIKRYHLIKQKEKELKKKELEVAEDDRTPEYVEGDYENVLNLQEELYGKKNLDTLNTMEKIADIRKRRDFYEASQIYEEILKNLYGFKLDSDIMRNIVVITLKTTDILLEYGETRKNYDMPFVDHFLQNNTKKIENLLLDCFQKYIEVFPPPHADKAVKDTYMTLLLEIVAFYIFKEDYEKAGNYMDVCSSLYKDDEPMSPIVFLKQKLYSAILLLEKDKNYLKALKAFYKVLDFTYNYAYPADAADDDADDAEKSKPYFPMHIRIYIRNKVLIYMNKLEERLLTHLNQLYNDANSSSNVDTKNNEFKNLLQYISEIIEQIDLILRITFYPTNLQELKQILEISSEIISKKLLVKSNTLSRDGNTGAINVNTEMVPIPAGGKKLLTHFTRKIKKRRNKK